MPDRRLTRPADEVAPALLGSTLSHETPEGVVTVELTEVEAYLGDSDAASHAYRGRTRRNAVMFGPAGRLYVYRSYGIHWCCNVVTGTDGVASAVLLRAGRVVDGVELARRRRGARIADRSLARGPGCLGQALGIDGTHYGADLSDGGAIRLELAEGPGGLVVTGHRVGVRYAHDVPLRFWLADEPTVSAYKRSPRAETRRA